MHQAISDIQLTFDGSNSVNSFNLKHLLLGQDT